MSDTTREVMAWDELGTAARALAAAVRDDGLAVPAMTRVLDSGHVSVGRSGATGTVLGALWCSRRIARADLTVVLDYGDVPMSHTARP